MIGSVARTSRTRWTAPVLLLATAASTVVAGTELSVSPSATADALGAPLHDDVHVSSVETPTSGFAGSTVCLADSDPSTLFDTEPNGIVGADYQRALELADGTVLWTFQDAALRDGGGTRVVHNIGVVQRGNCFEFLFGGSPGSPQSWLFPGSTVPYQRWFWPLDSTVGADGLVYVFAAEMRERGDEYLTQVEPVGTYVAGVDPQTWEVEFLGRPADGSASLYGWSTTADDDWTYLYAHCHRQFGFDPWIFVLAHDLSCTPIVTLARVPAGRIFDAPQYWTGRGWSPDPSAAVAVFETADRRSNPVDVVFENNRFHAVTKIHDWWGREIVVERASRPFGPWEEVDRWIAPAKCFAECNTYYASWAPSRTDEMLVGLSHNTWVGVPDRRYRPTFVPFAIPPDSPRPADRCSSHHCG